MRVSEGVNVSVDFLILYFLNRNEKGGTLHKKAIIISLERLSKSPSPFRRKLFCRDVLFKRRVKEKINLLLNVIIKLYYFRSEYCYKGCYLHIFVNQYSEY